MDAETLSLIIAAATLTIGTLRVVGSLTKAWGAAWHAANVPAIDWPVCWACKGLGERGRIEPRCWTCGGGGRTRPGFFSRLRRALGGLVFF